ncbi:MAG: hypothetical protein COW71_15155 [Ignavibacteriales bacterium CG18_big_fil_WC_8_21_14_2_50_31_20]|nr:MAG: hypothetical protein COW71_15155 [Ignavibacteriales bacterium CG18_big_fil_WC_8_21_14_2_50_31_20]
MFFKKINNKNFDYIPRFYNPEDDKMEKRKKKLNFRSDSKTRKINKVPIYLLVFVLVIIYLIVKLNGV